MFVTNLWPNLIWGTESCKRSMKARIKGFQVMFIKTQKLRVTKQTIIVSSKRIIIKMMRNFYSPASNTRGHSIGHQVQERQEKILDRQSTGWERALGGKAILNRCVWAGNGKLSKKMNFWYREGVSSRVVDQWQKSSYCEDGCGRGYEMADASSGEA